jgi:hypothetical protein
MHFYYFTTYTSTESTQTNFAWKVNSALDKREVINFISAKYHDNRPPFVKGIRPHSWNFYGKMRKELLKLS